MRSGNVATSDINSAFLQCQNCRRTLFRREFEENLCVCGHCGHHHRLTAAQRIEATFDAETFVETNSELRSLDPLTFPEYREKLEGAMRKTGLNDAIVTGHAKITGKPVSVAISDFSFMGGSMGSVAGEKITRSLEYAANHRMPCVIFCASGGARMQEGLLSLMQMAKTTAGVEKCRSAGVPFIAVFTDPTMAGVLASYASVADVILSEPKALIGFAGARVSKQAQVVKAPDDFQTAEFVLKSGMIDRIVHRRDLRGTLSTLVRILGGKL